MAVPILYCSMYPPGVGQVQPGWPFPARILHLLLPVENASILMQGRPPQKTQVRHPLLQVHRHGWLRKNRPHWRHIGGRHNRGIWHEWPWESVRIGWRGDCRLRWSMTVRRQGSGGKVGKCMSRLRGCIYSFNFRVYPIEYTYGFVVLCFVVVILMA